MSKGNIFEADLLKLVFLATAIANIADNAAAAPLTNLFVSLHTADPGEAGNQSTSEAAYAGYARVAVPRGAGGWTESGASQVANAALITFPASTSGPETELFFGVGVAGAGATKLLYSGAITTPPTGLVVNAGIAPEFAIGALVVTED